MRISYSSSSQPSDEKHRLEDVARDLALHLRGQFRKFRRDVDEVLELVAEARRKFDHVLQVLTEEEGNFETELEELGPPWGPSPIATPRLSNRFEELEISHTDGVEEDAFFIATAVVSQASFVSPSTCGGRRRQKV